MNNFNDVDTNVINASFDSLTNNIAQCVYSDSTSHVLTKNSKDNLLILHFNNRSLQKHYDTFFEFLITWHISPDIICISESRLKHNPLTNVNLPGYTLIRTNSPTNAGGVAMYIANNIAYELKTDYEMKIDGCENIWIKLCNSNIVIGTIYRHPKNNMHLFLDSLNKQLDMFKQKTVFLIGDFNINLTSSSNTLVNLASDCINLLASYGYFPLITIPTRVTRNSSTLIDHILTNDSLHAIKPGVIRTDLTDHYPIFCSISDKIIRKESQPIYKRNLSNFKTDDFSLDLLYIVVLLHFLT